MALTARGEGLGVRAAARVVKKSPSRMIGSSDEGEGLSGQPQERVVQAGANFYSDESGQ